MTAKRLTISCLILALILPMTACGNATTLARIGAGFQQAVRGFQGEIASLKASGLLTPEKAQRLERAGRGLTATANALESYLNSLPGVTAGNKAEILGKIAEATSLLSALLQNPDLKGLSPDTLIIKILNFATITLQQAAIAVATINPIVPPKGAVVTDQGVPLSSVKVEIPSVPKGAEKYFK